ncbi:TetR/AcrR family transcriptional regulator [Romboutsia weinsteinii]|uniref:TetR/AcrR family transcriptional regulator n=1 Tax=Romboutsia weinsteinii TaxID=2020949 RepID=A0A371J4Z0_9FIRM|nr:TetR/AcrR family transcriptional regulator [Romboutsia weinsteinii]RDY27861.1 TetR/AcrR family transcriptional regulator [Romboutsia weinsteinii]
MNIDESIDLREKIIKEASKLFISQGYNKTTIRQIAEVSGVGRGHLYYYFKKKEDILLHLYRDILDKLYVYINENLNPNSDPLVNYAVTQCIFTYVLASSNQLFRMYIEASSISLVKKEYINILIDLFNEKMYGTNYRFSEENIYISMAIGSSGGWELLNRYYNDEIDLDLDDILKSTIKSKLLLLDIEHIKVNEIIDEALKISKQLNTNDIVDLFEIY